MPIKNLTKTAKAVIEVQHEFLFFFVSNFVFFYNILMTNTQLNFEIRMCEVKHAGRL